MGHAASAACFCAFAAAGYGMFGTCCATAFTVTLVAASPLLGRLVTVALLADTLLMVPEWLGPVVRISLGWFGREVSHVGASNPSPNPNPDPDPDPTPTPTPNPFPYPNPNPDPNPDPNPEPNPCVKLGGQRHGVGLWLSP